MTITISGIEIGAGQPCRFVAEISNNHNGSLERAHRLIDAAKASGADFAKYQCFLPSELVSLRGDGPAPEPWGSQGWTMASLYEKAQTPHAWFPALVAHCNEIGLPWFSSVFGYDSLALLESLDVPALKVARLDNSNDELARVIGQSQRPIIVSYDDSGAIWARYQRATAGRIALFCPPGYPQASFGLRRPENFYKFYREGTFDDFDGFSYHGTSIEPPIVAATLGAKLVECHMMLEAEPSELEANVSLTEVQFADMIRRVRAVEEMIAP